ncbi:MAG: cyclodeaminase/cyclohydrolase family protein [Aerococcus sp.]|nr:cyclodeaminase/cyclohydrolase family protein [Aerococcus sp.]
MPLIDMTIEGYINVLGSNEPAPGGGSASALAATQGIALTKMVAELTVGKKKYQDYEAEMTDVLHEATRLKIELLQAIDKDTEAFNEVSAVFSMPKQTDEEKAARKEAMQRALKIAANSPLDMMALIHEALQVTKRAVGKSNTNAASDLAVAALNLKSGLQGAWLNVLINLSGIKDETFVNDAKEKGLPMLQEGMTIADDIYQQILNER